MHSACLMEKNTQEIILHTSMRRAIESNMDASRICSGLLSRHGVTRSRSQNTMCWRSVDLSFNLDRLNLPSFALYSEAPLHYSQFNVAMEVLDHDLSINCPSVLNMTVISAGTSLSGQVGHESSEVLVYVYMFQRFIYKK